MREAPAPWLPRLLIFQDGSGVAVLREAFLKGTALVILDPCNFKCVGNRQLILAEGLLRFGNELNQAQDSTT